MATLTFAQVRSLLTPPAGPCVSLYLSAQQSHPDTQQNDTLLRELADQADRSLRSAGQEQVGRPLLDRIHGLVGNTGFWADATPGLAVFAAPVFFETFWLPRPVDALAVVADSFHLKPLLRVTQSADRFHVLLLTKTSARLFEGNRYELHRVDRPGELPEYRAAVGTDPAQSDRMHPDRNVEQFFRAVDAAVLDRYSHRDGLPVVLAAIPDNASEFRKLSKNPHLVEEGVIKDPGTMALPDLRAAAWEVIQPRYTARLAGLTDKFRGALAHGLAAADPKEVGPAIVMNRVGTLLVDADRLLPGTVDPATGAVTPAPADAPGVDDLLDDLAELTLKTGGEVVVVPADRMPTQTGLAAVYRF